LNSDRATLPLDQAVSYLQSITHREVISVVPFGEFDLSNNLKSPDYVEPNTAELSNYLARISKEKFPYEIDSFKNWENADIDLMRAAKPVLERSAFTKIEFSNSFIIGDGENWITINLDQTHSLSGIELGKSAMFENVTEIQIPRELLRRLATRKEGFKGFTPMHWNQADVGSHFIWKRTGHFDLASHGLLNFYGV
jgi:hypothetical protein